MSKRYFAHSFIVETAAKAKLGDPAALDFLICYITAEIGSYDHDRLASTFRRFAADLQAGADRSGLKRDQINYEMEQAAIKVGKSDPNAVLFIRRYMIDNALKMPFSIWLSMQDVPLSELPKPAPKPDGIITLAPQFT